MSVIKAEKYRGSVKNQFQVLCAPSVRKTAASYFYCNFTRYRL